MSTALPADVWVPVSLRWRHIISGDLVVGRGGAVWRIDRAGSDYGPGMEVAASTASNTYSADVDPDGPITVLVPVIERDALELTREQLGARVIGRRALEVS